MHFKHQLWMYLGRSKRCFPLFRFIEVRKKGIEQTKKDTSVVIEGYPRSANTFAYAAFKLMQEDTFPNISVAHHIHGPMQLIQGIKLEIPCLLLIRAPVDSVVSLLIREERVNSVLAFKNYVKLHEKLLNHRDQMVISDFETTTKCFPDVVSAINVKYHTSFKVVEIDDEFMRRCKDRIIKMDKRDTGEKEVDKMKVGLPSEERRKKREEILVKIKKKVNPGLIKEANTIYQKFKAKSVT